MICQLVFQPSGGGLVDGGYTLNIFIPTSRTLAVSAFYPASPELTYKASPNAGSNSVKENSGFTSTPIRRFY